MSSSPHKPYCAHNLLCCRWLLPLTSAATSPCSSAAKRGPFGEASRLLYQFKTPEDLAKWTPYSDGELGGRSTAALTAADEPAVCLHREVSGSIGCR